MKPVVGERITGSGLFDRHQKMFQDRDRAETVGPFNGVNNRRYRGTSPIVERSSNFLRRSEPVGRSYPSRSLYAPSATMLAANRIKKKSIHQRLGVRSRISLPPQSTYNIYEPPSRRSGMGFLDRWGSGGSLRQGPRRWQGFRRQGRFGARRRGGRWFGGYQRRWGQRGSLRIRGGRRAGRRFEPPPPSREQLDKELDSYMAGTKSVLDKEMDDYMIEGATAVDS